MKHKNVLKILEFRCQGRNWGKGGAPGRSLPLILEGDRITFFITFLSQSQRDFLSLNFVDKKNQAKIITMFDYYRLKESFYVEG